MFEILKRCFKGSELYYEYDSLPESSPKVYDPQPTESVVNSLKSSTNLPLDQSLSASFKESLIEADKIISQNL